MLDEVELGISGMAGNGLVATLPPETNIAPENGWLEVGILVSFWDGLFSGAMLVLGSVNVCCCTNHIF